jgi:ribosomal protein S18 acetylase RimI-like enzyme
MSQVKQLRSKPEILRILEQDRLYAAYAIGDLAPELFRECDWFAANADGAAPALCLYFKGLEPRALFVLGPPEGVAAILSSALRPGVAAFAARPEHLPALLSLYALEHEQAMWRMALTAATFRPAPSPAVVQLGAADIDDLNRLYKLGWGGIFAPYQIAQGIYYGLHVRDQLVAAAGTHVVAEEYGIAAVGNVFTHPAHRNRGYATVCTSAVVAELLEMGCRDVVLNVRLDNEPALHAYRCLGFREYCQFVEAVGTRKGSWRAWVEKLWVGGG